MAWVDLNQQQQELVKDFIRNYRAAFAETARGLRKQQLLSVEYAQTIAPLWAIIAAGDVIPDGTGLAGADTTMTKSGFTTKFTWTSNLLAAVFSDNGGAAATVWPDRETVEAHAVQLAGPANVS